MRGGPACSWRWSDVPPSGRRLFSAPTAAPWPPRVAHVRPSGDRKPPGVAFPTRRPMSPRGQTWACSKSFSNSHLHDVLYAAERKRPHAAARRALAPPDGQVVPMASGCWLPVTGGYRVFRLTVILRARRADNPQLPVTFGKSGNRTRRHGSRSCLCSATFIQHFWVFSSPATFAALSTRPCPRMRLLKMGLDSTSSPMDLHQSQ